MKIKNTNKIIFGLIMVFFATSACSGGGGVDMSHPLAKQLAGKSFGISSSDLLAMGSSCPTLIVGPGNSNVDTNFMAKAMDSESPMLGDSVEAPNIEGSSGDSGIYIGQGISSQLTIYFDGNGSFIVSKSGQEVLRGSWQPLGDDTLEATIEDQGEFYTVVTQVAISGSSLNMDLVEDYLGNECDSDSWTTEGAQAPSAGSATNSGGLDPVEPIDGASGGGGVVVNQIQPLIF